MPPKRQRRLSLNLRNLKIVPVSAKSYNSVCSNRSFRDKLTSAKESLKSIKEKSNMWSIREKNPTKPSMPTLNEVTASCQPTTESLDNVKGNICLLQQLGKGSSGVVHLGCYAPRLKLIAVKEITIQSREERTLVTNELVAMQSNMIPLNSPPASPGKLIRRQSSSEPSAVCDYLVGFHGVYREPKSPKITLWLEFMNGGSLQDYTDQQKPLPDRILRHVAYCILNGLEHMHSKRLLHRDLKPANVLVSRTGICKIADMGLATALDRCQSSLADFKGTVKYMSPERVAGEKYSFKSDIWSVGMILITLAKGEYPFDTTDGFFGLENDITTKEFPELPEINADFASLIYWMLERDPMHRCTAAEALLHPSISEWDEKAKSSSFVKEWEEAWPPPKHFKNDQVAEFAQDIAATLSKPVAEESSLQENPEKGYLKSMLRTLGFSSSKFKRPEIEAFAQELGIAYAVAKEAFDTLTQ